MADIPHELREAATYGTALYNSGYQAGLAAGKRAGMERAAEIADSEIKSLAMIDPGASPGECAAVAFAAIRSENDGHG